MSRWRALLISSALILAGCFTGPPPLKEYTVKQGDTLFLIGKAHGVSVDELKYWNDLNSDLIEVGQVLVVGHSLPVAPPMPASHNKTSAKSKGQKPSATSSLRMPPPKPCLAGPTADELNVEDGYSGSKGLEATDIKASLVRYLPNINSCLSSANSLPSTELVLDFNVGCNGQVTAIQVSSAGDWDPNLTECVTGTLRYTPFPAHALPDGERFSYPIRLAQ